MLHFIIGKEVEVILDHVQEALVEEAIQRVHEENLKSIMNQERKADQARHTLLAVQSLVREADQIHQGMIGQSHLVKSQRVRHQDTREHTAGVEVALQGEMIRAKETNAWTFFCSSLVLIFILLSNVSLYLENVEKRSL